ncbi:MAG: energy transducer TonB [Fluviicola sp.]
MKWYMIFWGLLIFSHQSFGQSVRQQNRAIEAEIAGQNPVIDSLFALQAVMNDSIYSVRNANQALIESLLKLYADTEDKKFAFHQKINETNDSLIDWNQFYRYEDVSLEQLMRFQKELPQQPAGISVMIDYLSPFLTERKRMSPKERNAFLKQKLAFFSGLKVSLENTIPQQEAQLLSKQTDQLKLISWQKTMEKTRDYCLGKLGLSPSGISEPLKMNESKLYKCGAEDIEQISSDSLFRQTVAEMEYVKQPEFPGGVSELLSYLNRATENHEIHFDDAWKSVKISLKFIITDNGEIRLPTVTRTSDDCPECEKKALEIIRSMPRWTPARKGGHPVSFEYRLPVKFN